MEQQIRFCTTSDGVRIAYAIIAADQPGLPVVWCGWWQHLQMDWEGEEARRTWEPLARHRPVIWFSRRGCGLSDREVTDFSLQSQALDLDAVISHLTLERCFLIGNGPGGPLAIAYTAANPNKVGRLVLFDGYCRGPNLTSSERQEAFLALIRAHWGLGSKALIDIFIPGASPEIEQYFVRYQREVASPENVAGMLLELYRTDVTDLLPQVTVPTLILHRTGSRAMPFKQGREMAALIPNARLVPLEGNSSSLFAPDADENNGRIADFLREGEASVRPRVSDAATAGAPITIMFTDMEGSTGLTQRLGDAKAQELLRAHNTIVRDALKAHAGSEIKHTGDGIMASFAAASRALDCAIAIQRAFATLNAGVGAPLGDGGGAGGAAPRGGVAPTPIRVRIGLNAGEPVAEDADLFGTAVQLAARVCAQAQPAQILVPEGVRHLVAGKNFLFSDQGDIALRGFEDPVRLYEVRWREDA